MSSDFVVIEKGKSSSTVLNIHNFNEDLTHRTDSQWNIVKILKPRYEEVWARPEETKKDITMEEIIKDYEERNKCKVNITKGDM